MAQRYVVSLEKEERQELLRLRHTGKGAARKLSHARILLHADQASGESRRTDEQIAAALEVSVDTVERVRRRFVEEGLEAAIELKPWRKRQWCIPPEHNAAFVCQREDVLETYRLPYNPKIPVVCMDEASKQLIRETRLIIPARPGQLETFDHEYAREGVCNLFMFCEPLAGRRHVRVTTYTQARQLVECRGDRTQRARAAVFGPPNCRRGHVDPRGGRLGGGA